MIYINSEKIFKTPVQRVLMKASFLNALSIIFSFIFLYGWGGMFNYKEVVNFIFGWLILQVLIVSLMLSVPLFYFCLPRYFFDNVIGWRNIARLLLSAVGAALLGFLMDIFFPVGIKLFMVNKVDLTPWFWGVSSAALVIVSLLAAVLLLNYGLSASWWIGIACYLCSAILGYVYFKIIVQSKFEHI